MKGNAKRIWKRRTIRAGKTTKQGEITDIGKGKE